MLKLEELNKKSLINLIKDYDSYINDICEDEQNIINNCPVNVNEYLNNEFSEGKDLKDLTNPIKINNIVEEIVSDIKDRRGIGHEWYNIDDDIQEEIKETWCDIIKNNL